MKVGDILKFKYGSSSYDGRPGYVGPHWGEVKVVSIDGENVKMHKKIKGKFDPTSEFTSSVPHLQRLQSEYENQMGNKSKLSETKTTMKKSQLRQIIREEIQKAISEGFIANRDGAHLKADGKGKYWTLGKLDNSGLYTGKPDKRCQWCMENFHAFGGGRGGYGHTIDLHEFEITARPEKGFAMSRKYSDRGDNDALDYVA